MTPSEPELLGTDERCVIPGVCGNGYIEQGEECDDGEKNDDRNHCHTDCRVNTCGDGHVDPREECDDGALNDNDRDCRKDCFINRCGDGFVDTQGEHREQCDGAPPAAQYSGAAMPVETPDCNLDCTIPICGDGKVNLAAGEECDDGARNDDNGDCRTDCILNRCGDGFVNTKGSHPEDCDDAPQADTKSRDVHPTMSPACNSNCTTARCGDGIVNPLFKPVPGSDLTEQCDDRGTTGGDGCSSTCRLESCGNGVVDVDLYEQCDGAAGPQPCSASCRQEICGNGIVDPGEVCDDHNTDACGSCSSDCHMVTSRRAVGFILAALGTALSDGETFTLNDGIHPPLVFELDIDTDGHVAEGHVPVSFNQANSTAAQVRQAIETAIQQQHDLGKLLITASHDSTNEALALLAHDRPTSQGNQAIMSGAAPGATPGLVTVGMANGEGGNCAKDKDCSSDDDCTSHNCNAHRCE